MLDYTKPSDYFFGILVISKHLILQLLNSHKFGLTSFSALRCVNLDPRGVVVNGWKKKVKGKITEFMGHTCLVWLCFELKYKFV